MGPCQFQRDFTLITLGNDDAGRAQSQEHVGNSMLEIVRCNCHDFVLYQSRYLDDDEYRYRFTSTVVQVMESSAEEPNKD